MSWRRVAFRWGPIGSPQHLRPVPMLHLFESEGWIRGDEYERELAI